MSTKLLVILVQLCQPLPEYCSLEVHPPPPTYSPVRGWARRRRSGEINTRTHTINSKLQLTLCLIHFLIPIEFCSSEDKLIPIKTWSWWITKAFSNINRDEKILQIYEITFQLFLWTLPLKSSLHWKIVFNSKRGSMAIWLKSPFRKNSIYIG